MKTDIKQFADLLLSFSKISHLKFEILDADELLFSSESDSANAPLSEEHRQFSTQILSSGSFLHATGNSHHEMFGVPLRNSGEVIGSLIAYRSNSDKGQFMGLADAPETSHPQQMETFLTRLAELIQERWTVESEIEDMAHELTKSFEDLYLYSKIATQLKTLQVSGSMLEDLCKQLLDTMRIDLAFAKLDGRHECETLVHTEGLPERVSGLKAFLARLIGSISAADCSVNENYLIINDSRVTSGYKELHPDPYRFLAVPVRHAGSLYGWIGLVSFNMNEVFRRSELHLLVSIAEQIGIVIANTDLYRDLERFVISVVKSLVQAIEAKDVYTRGHSERVSRYCSLMAAKLNLHPSEKANLQWASILHDIGKIGISERILNKPASLDDREYSIIKGHPTKGCQILKPLEQLSESMPGILHHHERYDGRGYPRGLKGEEIPFLARIIAIADTFDAITSARPYRAAKTPEKALKIMEEVAGEQLDPDLVELFKEVIDEELGLDSLEQMDQRELTLWRQLK